ncbi:MAG: GNAT family N-acetyltransferase [Actinomycetes bacterium]
MSTSPPALPWSYGRRVSHKRLMAVTGPEFRPAAGVAGLVTREAGVDATDTVAALDAAAFGNAVDPARTWVRRYLDAPQALVLVAWLDGEPVGTATGLRSDGDAGPCVEVSAVGVLEQARERGIGAALTSAVTTWGFASGADLAWLGPESDDAARLYERLGYAETAGLDIYVDV